MSRKRGLSKETKELYTSLGRSIFLCFVALFAIVTATVAWFVSNDRTIADSSKISANDLIPFYIATLKDNSKQGVFDNNHETVIAALNRINSKNSGKNQQFDSIESLPALSIGDNIYSSNGQQYIIGNGESISMMVNADSNVNNYDEEGTIGPGSKGHFSFFIIPNEDNLSNVTINIKIDPFKLKSTGSKTGIAESISGENHDIFNILKGHFLLFMNYSEQGYEDRIMPKLDVYNELVYSFTLPNDSGFIKGVPYEVTLYWIWPKRFEDIKYFATEDHVFNSSTETYLSYMEWINDNRNLMVYKVFGNGNQLTDPRFELTNAQLNQWNTGYNKGDQLIGDTVSYFQWIIEAR